MTDPSTAYASFMLTPQPGRGVCELCFNLTEGYRRCWACAHGGRLLDAFAPISYSVSGGPLHAALAGYKRACGSRADGLRAGLAAVLSRFLAVHERCVAQAAGIDRFELVTTVPSVDAQRDASHPLRTMVAQSVGPARGRYAQLLARSDAETALHRFDRSRYACSEPLEGRSVLLIDDMWTTGASAQSAAAVLKTAGAGAVGAVVIGRFINGDWHDNACRVRNLAAPFRWERCVLEGHRSSPEQMPASDRDVGLERVPSPGYDD